MHLLSIELEGFRSFSKRQTLQIGKLQPGLYHLSGDNGAGKSTLFDSVQWALYGSTARRLRGTSVRTWGVKTPCSVTLRFEGGHSITRTAGGKKNSLILNGREVDQKEVSAFIGLSIEAFQNVAYFAQFTPFFLDLPPASRMQVFSEVLGLEVWDRASDVAQAYRKDRVQSKTELETKAERLRGQIEGLGLEELERSAKEWGSDHNKRLEQMRKALDKHRAELIALKKECARAEEELSHHLRAQRTKQKSIESHKARIEDISAQIADMRERLAVERARVNDFKNRLSTFNTIRSARSCPQCGQTIDKQHAEKHAQSLRFELKAAEQLCAHMYVPQLEKLEAELKQEQASIRELEDSMPNIDTFRSLSSAAHARLKAEREALERMEKEFETLSESSNPLKLVLEERRSRQAELKRRLRTLEKAVQEESEVIEALDYWAKALKDIRYNVLQESLVHLNIEANDSLTSFGMSEWELLFDVEKENKAGTSIKRGFLCSVRSPASGSEEVAWEVWSGGESQRLRLAAQFGISNLLSGRSGINFNFEFWDEPSTWLSSDGIKDLLFILKERAERCGKIALIADHRVLDFPFAGTIEVTKSAQGSVVNLR